jgi:6-phosphogluconolactonase (cycloisomerase 2 family)
VVTEKDTNTIDVLAVGLDGLPGSRVPTSSNGATPFGFSFGLRDQLFVSEAFGGTPDASAVSSYVSNGDGTLTLITGSAPTTETAACWVIVTGDGRFAYTTNTGSGSITGYGIGNDGSLTILDADGRTGITGTGSSPIDLALSVGSRFLYSLDSGDAKISAFQVGNDGGLESIGTIDAPATANGLAAR